jgi:hypothetical protein
MEVEKGKGGFILQQLIEWTKNSSNLIDWEKKFVRWIFILEANGRHI